jgi:hypothetical protein
MNDIELLIVKISRLKTLLRPLNLLMVLVPAFFYNKFGSHVFWIIWVVFWLTLFFFNVSFLKRYQPVGSLNINLNRIKITHENNETIFHSDDKLDIYISYNGYKGGHENYHVAQLPITIKDGLGFMEITKNGLKQKYDFVALRECKKRLILFQNEFEKSGNKVVLVISK